MTNQIPVQGVIISQSAPKENQGQLLLALFNEDGTPFVPSQSSQMPNQADSTAADVAGMVTDFNALLAKLQDAGLMASA